MKVLYCCKCGDIRAFNETFTSCRCGNTEARWVDPRLGTVHVRAREKAYARIIGLNNSMLRKSAELTDSLYIDYGHSKWKEFHDEATNAPGYIFDKSLRNCWACIMRVGQTTDIAWSPDQNEFANTSSSSETSS
jgi:hypothetical protein